MPDRSGEVERVLEEAESLRFVSWVDGPKHLLGLARQSNAMFLGTGEGYQTDEEVR